ncbi:hypothetical protein CSC62_12310 [Pseudoxanthomonas jiangsuensis]|uniref:hypothetical protein n=1 Tax=Pseudoxanthomonas jiangsuensis TaxID=619688 RepID=UPI001391804C|nr:hypothetical protein [Pseudoxanthomonas jiangsuensis]KAF1694247.1 hypothetical protein CSC62_12310 [Pseudoxanthomonas jiangsuensis]
MSRRIHRLVFALCLALAAPLAHAEEDISKVNGSIEAAAGQHYRDLETVNGSIRIGDGTQARDASTVNGSITVGDRAQVDGLETVNGAIRLGTGVKVSSGIETVNGSVFADRGSVIGGDIETVNGAIGLVGTELAGDIETLNGDVTVGIGSRVKGGITVERNTGWFQGKGRRDPRVVIGPDAVVEGPLVFKREVHLHVHRSARIGPVTGAEARIYDTDTAPQD